MHTLASLHPRWSTWWLAAAAIAMSGCSEQASLPTAAGNDDPALEVAPAPGGLTTVDGTGIRLWPFLSTDLEAAHDPLSILVTGEGDPRRIRAALLSVDGDRSALPPPFDGLAMFDCTWIDGIGDEQATYIAGLGWSASAIQLECGAFGPAPRFHVRLFDAGTAVLIGAHFEIQVPGTTDHEVLNFDIAKALVAADLLRAGVAQPDGGKANDPHVTAIAVPHLRSDDVEQQIQRLLIAKIGERPATQPNRRGNCLIPLLIPLALAPLSPRLRVPLSGRCKLLRSFQMRLGLFRERDQLLDDGAKLLRLLERRHDPATDLRFPLGLLGPESMQQADGHIAEHRFTVRRIPVQSSTTDAVTHSTKLRSEDSKVVGGFRNQPARRNPY